jgi:ABC-2 type transport system ATP-binding protein
MTISSEQRVLVRTQGLTKRYGDFVALNGVSLTVRKGDIYGLVGRNGAGKTTFFKCLMGLAPFSAGHIEIGDSKKRGLSAARRTMGFMIHPSFFPYLDPQQNLSYLYKIKGLHTKEIPNLLKLVGLEGVKKPFKAFSLGMKQRLGIAGALLGAPPLVVLDEPINGLDPEGIADIRNIIKTANERLGITFIVSSHILSELDLMASRFGFIEQGVLLKEISHQELHEETKKSLLIEVTDPIRAQAVLTQVLKVQDSTVTGQRITLNAYLDTPQVLARTLIEHGVELVQLKRQETTLEEYFMRLIGGQPHA